MNVIALSLVATAILFVLFLLVYRTNKTSLLSGFTFGAFLFAMISTYAIIVITYPESPFLLYPLIALFGLALIVPLFGIYILIAFLLHNARTVFRKEGRSLSNSLTLIAAIGIIVLLLVSWAMSSQSLPMWLQALWAGVLSIVTIYTFVVFVFLTTSALCSIAHPRKDKDYIIVLGSGLIDGRVTPLLAGRIRRAIQFARKQEKITGKLPVLVMSGGQGADEPLPESEAMVAFALAAGYDAEHLIAETKSTNTAENMALSKAIMDTRSPQGYRAIFSTSSYHVMRAGIYARRAGLKIDGIGAPTAWYYLPNALLREFIALLVMRKKRFVAVVIAVFLLTAITYGLPYYLLQMLEAAT
ncbi:YdcF family protein [Raoultibacter massiliensis]|uniref:YdcF family protein n=1 Tax=Raoultibacter massiliensis TaxID=1852371 RepID=UPI003A8F54E0